MDTIEIRRFWRKVKKGRGCWEWMAAERGRGRPYGVVAVRVSPRSAAAKYVSQAAHRVAWELENGPIPDNLFVCHRCNNKRCVRPSHLYLGTNKSNMDDAARAGSLDWRPGDRRGRPLSGRKTKLVGLNFFHADIALMKRLAKKRGTTNSGLVRELLRACS